MTFLSKEVSGLSGERWFGLDLAKRETQLSVLDSGGKQVFTKRFPTTREQFLALAAELNQTDTVALEVTTNSTSIARLIRDNSAAKIIVSNPIKTKVIAQAKIKTDKIDARVLAELARVGYLPEVWLPDEDTESLRQFISDRTSLVRRRTEYKNTVHSVLHRNLIHQTRSDLFGAGGREWLEQLIAGTSDIRIDELDRLRLGSLLNEIDRIDALVADQESIIASFIALRPKLLEQLDRLMSVPGINLVTGAGIISAIGDVHRFPDKKKLAAYFGVVPSTKQSGDSSRNGRITKQGRAEARWLLIEAAEHLRKAPGPMRALFTRVSRRAGHNVAVVAVSRKLAELVHHLLTREEDYVYKQHKLTGDKRSRVRFLARQKIGVRVASASRKSSGRTALYGLRTDGKGTTIKNRIVRSASLQAERLYEALVRQQQQKRSDPDAPFVDPSTLVFDPTRPSETDWETILKQVAEKILRAYKTKPGH
jgi:transposase